MQISFKLQNQQIMLKLIIVNWQSTVADFIFDRHFCYDTIFSHNHTKNVVMSKFFCRQASQSCQSCQSCQKFLVALWTITWFFPLSIIWTYHYQQFSLFRECHFHTEDHVWAFEHLSIWAFLIQREINIHLLCNHSMQT